MKIIISNVSGIPIYEQIKEQIKAEILSGKLCENDALPSLRTLAKELKISVLTTNRAYSELEQEGFVQTIQGKGCFVLGSGSELIQEQWIKQMEEHLQMSLEAAKKAGVSCEEIHQLVNLFMEEKGND